MMDDDAWKGYTDETLEQLKRRFEVEIEFKRRSRFLRSQGFACRQIAERLNELGVKDPQGRDLIRYATVYNHTKDVVLPHSHANGGRQWSEETRRHVDEVKSWRLRRQAMRARFSDD